MIITCVFKNVNKLDSSMTAHQNTWGESVTGSKTGLGKRQRGLELLEYFRFQCGCQWMHRQTMVVPMCMHSGFLLKDQSR